MNDNEYTALLSEISSLAEKIVKLCSENGKKLATAESCTGGMLSAAITAVSGSSSVIELGICSYSNRIKNEVLGVDTSILESYTEYSIQCAEAMANGVRKNALSNYAVSTTGVAGPTGGTSDHPVGEVCIGISTDKTNYGERYVFTQKSGDCFSARDYIRASAAKQALICLYDAIKKDLSTER